MTNKLAMLLCLIGVAYPAFAEDGTLSLSAELKQRAAGLAKDIADSEEVIHVIKQQGVEDLAEGNRGSIKALSGILASNDWRFKQGASELLADITAVGDDDTIELVIGEIGSLDEMWSGKIVRALGRTNGLAAVPYLAQGIDNKDTRLARDAGSALTALASKGIKGFGSVLIMSVKSPGPKALERVTNALGWSGDPDSIPYLVSWLENPNERVQRRAGRALVTLSNRGCSEEVFTALSELLDEVEQGEQIRLLTILGEAGGAKALQPLRRYLNSGDESIRAAAARGLSKQTDDPEGAQQILVARMRKEDSPAVLKELIGCLRPEAGPEGTSALLYRLSRTDAMVQREVVAALDRVAGKKMSAHEWRKLATYEGRGDIARPKLPEEDGAHDGYMADPPPVSGGFSWPTLASLVVALGLVAGLVVASVKLSSRSRRIMGRSEDRQHARIGSELAVKYRLIGQDQSFTPTGLMTGTTKDVSAGGIQLVAAVANPAWVPAITKGKVFIGVEIPLPGETEPVRAYTRLAWIKPAEAQPNTFVMGLRFKELTRVDQDKLTKHVVEMGMAGEQPHRSESVA